MLSQKAIVVEKQIVLGYKLSPPNTPSNRAVFRGHTNDVQVLMHVFSTDNAQ